MKKHAFLLQVHNNKSQLIKLLDYLDYPDNDIYIHIDAKSHALDGIESYEAVHSKIYFIPRIRVHWGGYSQIQVEMALLESALANGEYVRFHMLSGADMPLVTEKQLHAFFDMHGTTEFIHFDMIQDEGQIRNRLAQYHLLRDHIDRSQRILCGVEKGLLLVQKALRVDRLRNSDLVLRKGANWFSITGNCAKYVASKAKWIEDHFKYTKCCDEVFLQTIVYNSNFRDSLFPKTKNIIYENMRLTDWKRGNPYTFHMEDLEMLMSSGYIFARKFDENVDNTIIESIYRRLLEKGE